METLSSLPRPENIGPLTLDGLLGLRGVVETRERRKTKPRRQAPGSNSRRSRHSACAVARCAATKARLSAVLGQRIDGIETLTSAADACPCPSAPGDTGRSARGGRGGFANVPFRRDAAYQEAAAACRQGDCARNRPSLSHAGAATPTARRGGADRTDGWTFWPRSSAAKPIRFAPNRTTRP